MSRYLYRFWMGWLGFNFFFLGLGETKNITKQIRTWHQRSEIFSSADALQPQQSLNLYNMKRDERSEISSEKFNEPP